MKKNPYSSFLFVMTALIGVLTLGSCFLFKGTSAEDEMAALQKEITDLTHKITVETNPATKAQLKRDLETMKKNFQDVMKRLVEEGKKVDLQKFLDDIEEGINDIGGK